MSQDYGGLGSNPGAKDKSGGAYGGLGENPGGRKGGTYRDDSVGHPVGHHGLSGHKGHKTSHRESHGGCKSCKASPCVCPP